jgi:uncharacterized protein (TIGR03000 family)
MYSAVLVTALVTASTGPGFHRHGCHTYSACHGCYGGCHTSVYGYGCSGGCYGYHGGCYGGFGVIVADPYYGGCTGCYGAYGGHSCYGVPVPLQAMPPAVMPPVRDPLPPIIPDKKGEPEVVPLPKVKDKKKDEDKKAGDQESARARVHITVPDGGKLFVDGQHINVPAGTRMFHTPLLAPGQSYFYDIGIEFTRNGERQRMDRRILIRPGEEVAVSIDTLRPPGSYTASAPR